VLVRVLVLALPQYIMLGLLAATRIIITTVQLVRVACQKYLAIDYGRNGNQRNDSIIEKTTGQAVDLHGGVTVRPSSAGTIPPLSPVPGLLLAAG
jgi:hypothetical protein